MTRIPKVNNFEPIFLYKLVKDPVGYVTELYHEYGDIFQKRYMKHDHYYICNPKYLEQILQTNQDNYIKHPFMSKLEPFFGENNLLTTTNLPRWEKDRPLAQTAFETNEYFEKYSVVITSKSKEMLDDWEQQIQNNPKIDHIGILIDKLIVNIIKDTIFFNIDIDVEATTKHISASFNIIMEKQTSLIPFLWDLPTSKKRRQDHEIRFMKNESEKIVSSRLRTGKDYDDLLGTFLDAYPEEGKCPFMNATVANYMKGFLMAGASPSAAALLWALTMLALHPVVNEKISAEVQAVCKGNIPCYEDYHALRYTQAFINEVLRVHPPFAFVLRQAIEEDRFEEFTIPPGGSITITPSIIHQHPKYWDNPTEFSPERFLNKPWGQDYQYAYMPFSMGKRGCLGKNFALLKLCLIVAMVSQRFQLQLPKNFVVKNRYLASIFVRPNIESLYVAKK